MEQELKKFGVRSQTLVQLSKAVDCDDIFIVRVMAIDGNLEHLFSHIKITTTESNSGTVVPFNAAPYFTPYHQQAVTSDFLISLRNCSNKSIYIDNADDFELTFFYKKAVFKIDRLVINVVRQLDGLNFSLNPQNSGKIRNSFPDAIPSRSVFISEDARLNFETMHDSIYYHVLPALTGLDTISLNFIKEIVFQDIVEGREILSVYFDYTGEHGQKGNEVRA